MIAYGEFSAVQEFIEIIIPTVTALAQALAAVLGAVVTLKPPQEKASHRACIAAFALFGAVGVIGVAATARIQHDERHRAERDFAYLRTVKSNGGLLFYLDSTGVLRDTKIGIQTVAERLKGSKIYVCCAGTQLIDRGVTPVNVPIGPGDWVIDIDPPTDYGKILEILHIKENLEATWEVKRKGTWEVLVPAAPSKPVNPQTIVGVSLLILFLFLGALLHSLPRVRALKW